jgi:hypothetical protein
MTRLDIRAPSAGIVHGLKASTPWRINIDCPSRPPRCRAWNN